MRLRRLLNLFLHAYPQEIRLSHGGEMLDTVLDVSNGSGWVLLRESLALLRGGLYARARLNTAVSGRRLLADAWAQAATLWTVISLASVLQFVVLSSVHLDFGEAGYLVLVGMTVPLALLGYDRIAGLCGFGWMVFLFGAVGHPGWDLGAHLLAPPLELHEILVLLVPFIGYGVMLIAPRSRPRGTWRVLLLTAAAVLVAVEPSLLRSQPGLPTLVLLAVSCAGLMLLPADPRLAIACGLVLTVAEIGRWMVTSHAVTGAPMSWLTAAGPIVLAASASRLGSARHRPFG